MNGTFSLIFTTALFAAMLRSSTSLLLSALGESYAERSGVLNLGLEGIMSMGAVAAFIVSFITKNIWMGFTAAMITGILMGLLFGFFTISMKTDQVVTGVAFTLFGVGFSFFLYRQYFGVVEELPQAARFTTLYVPLLSEIPIIGKILFQQYSYTYIALILVPILFFILYRTHWGLNIRAVGEKPRAADSLGINVSRTRYQCLIINGALGGLGGSFLSIAQFNSFLYNMVAGRGYIAVAIVIFGRWNPALVLVGSLIFGFADSLGLTLEAMGTGIASEVFLVLPYILTIIILPFATRRARVPSALAIPYEREEG
jgi:simple sugar transport system permease protein